MGCPSTITQSPLSKPHDMSCGIESSVNTIMKRRGSSVLV